MLGALVGFIPGVAITDNGRLICDDGGPYFDIPWLLIVGLVIALLVHSARSRLPLAARLT